MDIVKRKGEFITANTAKDLGNADFKRVSA